MEAKFKAWHVGGAFVAGIIVGGGATVAIGEATDSIRSPAERETAQKAREAAAKK
ncbi:hypothetical protein [Corallococcus sp. EGB]|uniref:hypothetical protein n=1 Tax=Corallococcus sp. EGB TaxID=1521117 RepID=UPI001CBF7B45|nr:hypothetical protein [Corallococcus sp. EGB]